VTTGDPPGPREQRRAKSGPAGRQVRFARALAGGRDEMRVRIPELAPLSDKTVIVVGTGGIGAPVVIEFAKAGVAELRFYDHDWVEPAASVRYPFGYADAGRLKVQALADHLCNHYPLIRLGGGPLRLGAVRRDAAERSEVAVIDEMMDGADLLFDGTADHGTSQHLCDVALSRRVPYVAASATLGGWGGRIVRFFPDEGPCYDCLLHHLADQDSSGSVPMADKLTPPADPAGDIRPAGCADATFTGAGFDLMQVAMAGVRLAVSTLCEDADVGYPRSLWNVEVLHFRAPDGSVVDNAYHHRLERHSDCNACRRRRTNGDECTNRVQT